MRTSTGAENSPPCGVITYMLPAAVRSAGKAGAPVESIAMRMVVSVSMAPAGTITCAPLTSVTVPPSAPITGGGAGGGGGGGGAGGGLFDVGGGVFAPPSPPAQPASAANKLNTHRMTLRRERMTPTL